jgi:hypothetical protein
VLAFVASATDVVAIVTLIFLTTYYVGKLRLDPISLRRRVCWRFVVMGMIITILSLAPPLITLIWLTRALKDLPNRIVHKPVRTLLIAWFALFGVSVLLGAAFFAFIVVWTKQSLQTRSPDNHSLDLDFGVGSADMVEARPDTRGTTGSCLSQDNTLATPPRTPTTPCPKSPLRSSLSTKVGPGSSRSKLVQDSAKSSFDDLPAGEARSLDNGFDRWDTSSVHQEVRAALQASSPATRSGLETIPGSRPESPLNALDGPFLPSSPHASTSDTATAVDWVPTASAKASLSSAPPASPPNFSRPGSTHRTKAAFHSHTEELANSPIALPVAAPGTMAGATMTSHTLNRTRSSTFTQTSGMDRPASTATSADGSAPGSPGPGSPGPSIIEEGDMPPILPGFVLSAGQRTSLVGYGRRKSVKERPTSSHAHAPPMDGTPF